jgi:hypothetical protein
MSRTSKSPRKVALEALSVAEDSLTAYSCRFSRKDFTQHQLFACLVLKAFFKTDYRGIVEILRDCPDLMTVLGLKTIPHFTTLQKASDRLLNQATAAQLLDGTIRQTLGDRPHIALAAMDSTGLECGQVSPYFVRRRSRKKGLWQTTTYTRFPKMELGVDCATHLVVALVTSLGPHPDTDRFRVLLFNLLRRVSTDTVLADAGYDSEGNHVFAREGCRVRSVIPAETGRRFLDPTQLPRGRWRRLMRRYRDYRYGQRWQVETVMSMIKRRLGHALRARSENRRNAEMRLMVLTHNIMICFCRVEGFLRSKSGRFFNERSCPLIRPEGSSARLSADRRCQGPSNRFRSAPALLSGYSVRLLRQATLQGNVDLLRSNLGLYGQDGCFNRNAFCGFAGR